MPESSQANKSTAEPRFDKADAPGSSATADAGQEAAVVPGRAEEVGGPAGPEPTRYGDWERKGRCIDF